MAVHCVAVFQTSDCSEIGSGIISLKCVFGRPVILSPLSHFFFRSVQISLCGQDAFSSMQHGEKFEYEI